jgi:hypothetical protein
LESLLLRPSLFLRFCLRNSIALADELLSAAISTVVFPSFMKFAARISVGVSLKWSSLRIPPIFNNNDPDPLLISKSPLRPPVQRIQSFWAKNAVFTLFSCNHMVVICENKQVKNANFDEREPRCVRRVSHVRLRGDPIPSEFEEGSLSNWRRVRKKKNEKEG